MEEKMSDCIDKLQNEIDELKSQIRDMKDYLPRIVRVRSAVRLRPRRLHLRVRNARKAEAAARKALPKNSS